MSLEALEEFLDRYFNELRVLSHVLNVAVGTKWVDGKDTHRPCITVFVDKKVEPHLLKANELIPKLIKGFETDVVELSTPDYKLGDTAPSRLKPSVQRRIAGGVKGLRPKPTESLGYTRAVMTLPPVPAIAYYATPTKDQGQCGSCLAHDDVETLESTIKLLKGDPNFPILLSPKDLFSCAGNGCGSGAQVITMANWLQQYGVVSEACNPYDGMANGTDSACCAGRCTDYLTDSWKITSWTNITDKAQMRSMLSTGKVVLAGEIQVPSSFMNYTGGGIYHSLSGDSIVGGHGIPVYFYDATFNAYLIRNSWGPTGWGIPTPPIQGWAWMAADDPITHLEDQMQQFNEPVTPMIANPCTAPCPFSMAIVDKPGGKWILRNFRKARKALTGIEPGKFPPA